MPKMKSKKNSIDTNEKFCRVCAKALSKHFPMVKVDDDIKIGISDGCTFKVAYELNFLNIKIDKNDGLPQEACLHCVEKISKIYSFRKLCELSQIKLRQIFDPLNTLTLTDISKSEVEDEEFILHNENCISPLPSSKKDATSENSSNVQLSTSRYENPQATTSKSALNEVILFDCDNASEFISEKDDYSLDSNEEAEMDVDTNSDDDQDYNFKEKKKTTKKTSSNYVRKPKYIRKPDIFKPRHKQKVYKLKNKLNEKIKNTGVILTNVENGENLKLTSLDINIVSESDPAFLSESEDSKVNVHKSPDQNAVKEEIESECYESIDYSTLINKKERLEDENDEENRIEENELDEMEIEVDNIDQAKINDNYKKGIYEDKISPCLSCNKFKYFRRQIRDNCIDLKKQKMSLLSDHCCYYCDEDFGNKQQVIDHIRNIHPVNKPFLCMDCNQHFDRHSNFILHSTMNHISESDLEKLEDNDQIGELNIQLCTECNKYKFQSRIHIDRLYCEDLRNNDELIQSLETDHCCYYCNEEFPNIKVLKEHIMNTHSYTKPFNCSKCDEKFMYYKERKYHHNLMHSNQNQIQCSICDMSLTSNYDFVEHVKMHTGDDHLIQKQEIVLCNICYKYKLLTRFIKDRLRCDRFEKNYRVPLSDKEFCCYYCNEMYDEKTKLHEHILNTHSIENPFNCIECNANFQSVNCRLTHYKKYHKNIDAYECPICDAKFKNRQKFYIHKNQYHTYKVYECTICSKKFYNTEKLRNHKLNHETVLPLKCKFCDRSFKQNQHLREHEKVHLDERPYKCETCGKTFRIRCTYQVHLRLHTGENLSICEICGESFLANYLLNVHKRSVHKENDGKMYICEHCGENFKELHLLNQHKKCHGDTNETIKTPKRHITRPRHLHKISFKCPVCEKMFQTPLAFQRHLKLHDKNRKYKCPECPYSYDSSWALIVHSRRMHPKEGFFGCYCGKTFSSPEEREEHKKIHSNKEKTYKCSYCNEIFSNKSARIKHERGVHTGEKDFRCLICGEAFISTLKLRTHTRNAHNIEENRRVEEQILAEVANQISKDA